LRRRALRGLTAAAVELQKQLKVVLSVPAPRTRVISRSGSVYYRATTPAIPGAPPRKLTGRLRASISFKIDAANLRATVGTNVIYGGRHERGNHPWRAVPTSRSARRPRSA
jgi:phage gpG-like protein